MQVEVSLKEWAEGGGRGVSDSPLTDSTGDLGEYEEPESTDSDAEHAIQAIVEASADREARLSRNRHDHHGSEHDRVLYKLVESPQKDEYEDLQNKHVS